jgi:predicted nucleic acid-binding protein
VRPVLLDTDVLSELVRARPDPRVAAFVAGVTSPLISVLTLHELTYGAAHSADPARRERLMAWIDTVRRRFEGRIIDVDAAEIAGRLRAAAGLAGRQTDPIDALIAASALVRGAAVATRNVRDFEPLGVDLIDPWAS